MDRQDYIEIILDHYEHPRNKGRMEDADIQLGGGNPGCGDLITVYVKVGEDDRIERVTFEGEGCTISQAGVDRPGGVRTVMRVLYLVFNEGYSGDVDLAAEAIRLTRQLAGRRSQGHRPRRRGNRHRTSCACA